MSDNPIDSLPIGEWATYPDGLAVYQKLPLALGVERVGDDVRLRVRWKGADGGADAQSQITLTPAAARHLAGILTAAAGPEATHAP